MGSGYTKFTEEHHAGSASGRPDVSPITPPVKPQNIPGPVVNKPNFYAPKQSVLQKVTYDPASTSHNMVERFGIPTHD